MTRELLIEGQHIDLAPDTDITLEYANNLVGDLGKINLSRSYTIRIPKTLRNTKVLDDPAQPEHDSELTRRFFVARFYRNGIDLLGPAQAYLLRTTPEAYEITLIWNTLEALKTLSQSKATLNDLPDLPILQWIGDSGDAPDYTSGSDGAVFAKYASGLGANKYPTVNTAPHPCMSQLNLINRILEGAGVSYTISAQAEAGAAQRVVLAAPSHKPNKEMELHSGCVAGSIMLVKTKNAGGEYVTGLSYGQWTKGWDSVIDGSMYFTVGENNSHRVLINFLAPIGTELPDTAITISGVKVSGNQVTDREEIARVYFEESEAGWFAYLDTEISLSGWTHYDIGIDTDLLIEAVLSSYDSSLPLLGLNRVHKEINIAQDNRFPLQGNLPDIKQWDFIKACMAMSGWVPVIQGEILHFRSYAEVLDKTNAYNWTGKVDMENGDPYEISYTLNNWAQKNIISFQTDTAHLGFDPNAALVVHDATINESRDLYKLPFAASRQSEALHYKVLDDGTVEDVDISPRIFKVNEDADTRSLYFSSDMYGPGLINAYYTKFQGALQKPVTLTLNIRLHEIDLAQLDLTRPVYLGQFGRYYAILKIQTSKTDLCKVELLQLP